MALLTGGRLQGKIPKESHSSQIWERGMRAGGEGEVQQCYSVWLSTFWPARSWGSGTRAQRLPTVGGEALRAHK